MLPMHPSRRHAISALSLLCALAIGTLPLACDEHHPRPYLDNDTSDIQSPDAPTPELDSDTQEDSQADLNADLPSDTSPLDTPDLAQPELEDQAGDLPPDLPPDLQDVIPDLDILPCQGQIRGRLSRDPEHLAQSHYVQRYSEDTHPPLTQVPVTLLLPKELSARPTALSDAKGDFCFDHASERAFLLVETPTSLHATSHNHGRHTAQAIRNGSIRVLTFGDSIPAYGPQPWFPELLANHLSALADAHSVNLAVPGSTTAQWLPNTRYFNERVLPNLEHTQLIVFSLGGNDLMAFAEAIELLSPEEAIAMLDQLDAQIALITANLRAIITELRRQAPQADIAWILYPNYASSQAWGEYLGPYQPIVENLMHAKLNEIRATMAQERDLLLIDLAAATLAMNLDALLDDPLHLNRAGHAFLADEIFVTLGGVLQGLNPRGTQRQMSFATR